MAIGVSDVIGNFRVPAESVSGDYCGWIRVYWKEEYNDIENWSKIIIYKIETTHSIYAGDNAFNLDIYVDGISIGSISHINSNAYSAGSGNDGWAETKIDGSPVYFESGRIYHNSDGNKSVTIKLFSNYYVNSSNGWRWNDADTEKSVTVALTKTHTHNYISAVTPPTCTAQGYTTYTCSCGDSYIDNYTDVLEHSYNSGVITISPTHESTGIKTYTCNNCGVTKVEALDKLIVTIYIDNGKSLDGYSVYIDNGSKWEEYMLYVDNGSSWDVYC